MKTLRDALEDCRLAAEREVKRSAKLYKKNPRYRVGLEFWKGMRQAYANARTLAAGYEMLAQPKKQSHAKFVNEQARRGEAFLAKPKSRHGKGKK